METILWRSRISAVPKYRIPLVIPKAVFTTGRDWTSEKGVSFDFIKFILQRVVDRVLETGKNQWDIIGPQQGFMFQGSWHVTWVLIFHATDSGITLNKNKGEEDSL